MLWYCCLTLLLLLPVSFRGQTTEASNAATAAQTTPLVVQFSKEAPAQYPPTAIASKVQGTVSVTAVISPSGEVIRAEANDGDPLLQDAALAAVRQSAFRVRRGDQETSTKVWAQLVLNFYIPATPAGNHAANPEITAHTIHSEEFPKSLRVPEKVMQSRLGKHVAPIYPLNGSNPASPGTVLLSAQIGEDGKVTNVQVMSGPAALGEAARDAARQWTYKPYSIAGEPVPVETQITMKFGRDDNPPPPPILMWMLEHHITIWKQVVVRPDSPQYPEAAIRMRGERNVLVTAKPDPTGQLMDLRAVQGESKLQQAALEVAGKEKIVPDRPGAQVAVFVQFVK